MTTNQDRIKYLLRQYADNNATESEVNELFSVVRTPEYDSFLKEWMNEKLNAPVPAMQYDMGRWDKVVEGILSSPVATLNPARKIWKRWAVAASIIVLLGIGYLIWLPRSARDDNGSKESIVTTNDVPAPDKTKAMITLSDGRIVALDSVVSGTLATEGNVSVIKNANGEIVYGGTSGPSTPLRVTYNTLLNPKGSRVQTITLVDGSKVWMNAESSLKYFTSVGNEPRRIEISGECYFEAAHDASKPFIVKDVSRGTEVEVLGTHFNVNTYSDEPVMKVTLLEGSVKVTQGSSVGLLKPGQQAQITNTVKVVNGVDLEQVMAWKNGTFYFNNTNIEVIMREAARWYDVEVSYEGNVKNEFFGGTVPRTENISQLIKALELTKTIKIDVEGKHIIVRQAK